MMTALVFTGVTCCKDLSHSSLQPDHVLRSIAELPDLLNTR
jgi:ribonucleotide monophosphatase NagD (HAD superfamily)